MKDKLNYQDYSLYFAQKCDVCHGKKRNLIDGIWTVCPCQKKATLKYRFESLQIDPPELKYKSWDDFTGIITEAGETVGTLSPDSVIEAKTKALAYCYKNGDNSSLDNLIVQKHLADGQNLVISGEKGSGKTLLAVLIVKEVVLANLKYALSMTFNWTQSSQIVYAAKWEIDGGISVKNQDYDYLEELSETDFLVVDDLDYEEKTGSHRQPPDRTSINVLFGERRRNQRPTIFICSDKIRNMIGTVKAERIRQQWGGELCSLVSNAKNIFIDLRKS